MEANDPEADEKFTAALQALKDLKYLLVDELDESIGTDMAQFVATPAVHPEPKASTEKAILIDTNVTVVENMTKSSDPFKTFLRRPEVTGTLVAIGCLAVVTLFKIQ